MANLYIPNIDGSYDGPLVYHSYYKVDHWKILDERIMKESNGISAYYNKTMEKVIDWYTIISRYIIYK